MRFVVTGRVQGVWFRESTRRTAEPLGIAGHAINLPDGTVEVLACGADEALERLEKWLWEGPRWAEVSGVESSEVEADCPPGFRTG